jgi:hypothetical protein
VAGISREWLKRIVLSMTRVLMPSIVDPALQIGGTWPYTRGLVSLLYATPFQAGVVPFHCCRIAERAPPASIPCIRRISGLAATGQYSFQHSRRMLNEIGATELRCRRFLNDPANPVPKIYSERASWHRGRPGPAPSRQGAIIRALSPSDTGLHHGIE